MLISRAGLGHKAVPDHFLDVLVFVSRSLVLVLASVLERLVLVLVLPLSGGLGQDRGLKF